MTQSEDMSIYQDIATLKANNAAQGKQLSEIHKALMGNGQPGLLAEMNQYKGAVKFFGIIFGLALSILTIAVGVLAIA